MLAVKSYCTVAIGIKKTNHFFPPASFKVSTAFLPRNRGKNSFWKPGTSAMPENFCSLGARGPNGVQEICDRHNLSFRGLSGQSRSRDCLFTDTQNAAHSPGTAQKWQSKWIQGQLLEFAAATQDYTFNSYIFITGFHSARTRPQICRLRHFTSSCGLFTSQGSKTKRTGGHSFITTRVLAVASSWPWTAEVPHPIMLPKIRQHFVT